MKKKIAIIGGGMMGLTLADRINRKNYDVTVFESADEIGGLASSWKLDEYYWDKFYHVILTSDSFLLKLLDELNLKDEIEWRETKTGFYREGKLFSVSNSLEFLRFPGLSISDKIRLGFTIFYSSKINNWKSLEGIPVENWLRKIGGNQNFENLWLPLLKAKLGKNYSKTSAVFIWTTIQRMYKARRSGLKKEMFGYVKGGYKRILETFLKKLNEEGVEINTASKINSITLKLDSSVTVNFNNGNKEDFHKIILTTPSSTIAKICSGLTDKEKNQLSNIQYLGVICASLLLKKSLSEYYITNITDNWLPFTGVIEMTALVDKKYFGGNALVYLPKYLSSDDPKFDLNDKEISDDYLQALKKMHKQLKDEDIIETQVARARNVFALPSLNYSDSLLNVNTSLKNIHIINSARIIDGTLNINEVIRVAEDSLKQIVDL